MIFNASKWFAGFTIIIQLNKSFVNTVDTEESERCTADENQLFYECSDRGLEEFPHEKYLNPKMQILNISSNPIVALSSEDLQPYTDLRELVMTNMRPTLFSAEFFSPVQKLEILNMNSTKLSTPVNLPASIKILFLADVSSRDAKAIDLDLTKLINLNEISLAQNGIQGFPVFNTKAPITHINLKGNPITNIEYIHLAPFCYLESFELETYSTGKQYDEKCCCVLMWLETHEVRNELSCGEVDGKKCEFNTNTQFSEEAIQLRNECIGSSSFTSKWLIIVNSVIGVLLMFIFAYLMVRFYRSDAVRAHRQGVKVIEEDEPVANEEEVPVDVENMVNFYPPLS